MDPPYWIVDSTIIFKPDFNDSLDDYLDIISNYEILYFSNFTDPYIAQKTNNVYNDQQNENKNLYSGSLFNKPFIKFANKKKFHKRLENKLYYFLGIPLDNSLSKFVNLRELTFGEKYNLPLDNSLFELTNLQKLTFGKDFNYPLGDSLSKLHNLRELTFGYWFNHSLGDSLSKLVNLRELIFGDYFNLPLGNSLSNLHNLGELTFGIDFNLHLGDSLLGLDNLTELTFGGYFNQPLGDSLLDLIKLQKLTFGYKFNQPLNDSLMNLHNLGELTLGCHFNQPFVIPDGIKKLTINCNSQHIVDYLPFSVEELIFGSCFDLELNDLPNSIKKITILNHKYDKKLNNLPSGIELLEIINTCEVSINREYKNLNIVKFLKN